MLRKTLAAFAAFAATLFFSLGCPQQDGSRETKTQPAPAVAAPDKTAATPAPAVAAQPKPDAVLPGPMSRRFRMFPLRQNRPTRRGRTRPKSRRCAERAVGPSPGAFANDPPFKDWPKPKAVIFCSGMQMGYIEPCGCSGKENQKGGLSRRASLLEKLARMVGRSKPSMSVDKSSGSANRPS